MEFLTAIGSKIVEYLVEATIHQARYLFCFNSIVEDLENEENKLKLAQDRIKKEVEQEEKNTKEIEKDVEKWLTDADDVMADVQRLKAEIQVKKSCLNGLCPNWGCRYWLSRKATKKTSVMLKLQNTGNFSTVAHLIPLPGIEFSAPRDFKSFKATELACDQLMEALKNEKTKIVGLYGAGGAGKTTLATVVGDKLRQQQVFDEVVIAVVSQNPNIINVQSKLAVSLSLELKEATTEERAKRLHLRFTETKSKILVILDDVWKQHDLKNELGIPVDDNRNGFKILLTTRRKQVCDRMGCNSSVTLGILEPEEGLALLKYHAGIDDDDSTLIDVSKEVSGECKGLPLAIAVVGSALRGKDVDEWKLVSQKLKNAELNDVDDVDVDVYACLKFSYDYLKDDNTKLCFLLCSLFPEDFEIDLEDLVRYGMGLGWYQGVGTIEKARSLLRGMIKGLKASSLLLDTGEEGFVKMHDIIRDVAIWIGSKEQNFFNKAGIGLTEWPENKGLKQCRAISLLENRIGVLPNGLGCPNLHTLLLGNHNGRLIVPDKFFEGMTALKVATIIGGDLSLKSLQFSTNLQVLQLIRCFVSGMTFLGKLKRLQILCLKQSSLDEIPDDLDDEFSKMKLIDFGFSEVRISLIKRFPELQEFYGEIKGWVVEGTISKINCGNVECLPKNFTFPHLQRYEIAIRDAHCHGQSQKKSLSITKIEATSLVIFSALYQNLQHLYLEKVTGCQNIFPSIVQRGLNELTSLILIDCEDLECIMDASQYVKSRNLVMFSSLATLLLINLQKLQWIWKAPAQNVGLQNLTEVEVRDCDNLTYLFSLPQARSLVQLKRLVVSRCGGLEHIIEAEFEDNEGRGEHVNLQNLTKVEVRDCDNLTYLFSLPQARSLVQLKRLVVSRCEGLERIIQAELEDNEGRGEHVNLQNLTEVEVEDCNNLTYLFSLSQARSLMQLEILKVSRCERLERIIEAMFDDNEGIKHTLGGDENTISLPMLREIRLDSLPNLTAFCSEYYHSTWLVLQELILVSCPHFTVSADEFEAIVPNLAEKLQVLGVKSCYHLCDVIVALLKHGLKYLEVLDIDNLGTQVLFQLQDVIVDGQESRLFPSLKRLCLYRLPEMEVLYKSHTHIFSLQNLISLTVHESHRLRYLLTPTLARSLLQLDELSIHSCSELEQIIEEDEEEDHLQPVCFPKLRKISIQWCHKLKRLFHVSVAPSLQKLEELIIIKIGELEEVFWHKDGEAIMDDKETVMTRLYNLNLSDLPNLTNCWPVGYRITFPFLQMKTVENCPKLRTNPVVKEQETTSEEYYSGDGDAILLRNLKALLQGH